MIGQGAGVHAQFLDAGHQFGNPAGAVKQAVMAVAVQVNERRFRHVGSSHPEWRDFGEEAGQHPPMRGWLAVPLIGSDGENYGFIQVSDRLEGDFTELDEANLVRLATLTSLALDALAQLHLPEYREKVRSL